MQVLRRAGSEVEGRVAMDALHSMMTNRSPRLRGLFVFGLLTMVIAGLFAMHVLSMSSLQGHASPTIAAKAHHAAAVAMPDEAMSGAVSNEAVTGPHCDHGYGEPMPGHSILMMGCMFALLVGAILLLAPRLLGHEGLTRMLAVRALPALGTVLARAQPPSLIVLSISRT